jgi:hypothetical protein
MRAALAIALLALAIALLALALAGARLPVGMPVRTVRLGAGRVLPVGLGAGRVLPVGFERHR